MSTDDSHLNWSRYPVDTQVTTADGVTKLSWLQEGEPYHLTGPDLETLLPHFGRLTHMIRDDAAAKA